MNYVLLIGGGIPTSAPKGPWWPWDHQRDLIEKQQSMTTFMTAFLVV
jgi:hypothetical protein